MTAITDAKTVVQIITGGTLPDNTRLLRIADAYVTYAGAMFTPVDPLNPTNEEKAENFLNILRRDGRRVLRNIAQGVEYDSNLADVQAAGDSAVGDL